MKKFWKLLRLNRIFNFITKMTYPVSFWERTFFIFDECNAPLPKHISSFADNITSTPTYAHDQVSEKLQFDTSVHAVSFCAFHQLLWNIFLGARNYLHQKIRILKYILTIFLLDLLTTIVTDQMEKSKEKYDDVLQSL